MHTYGRDIVGTSLHISQELFKQIKKIQALTTTFKEAHLLVPLPILGSRVRTYRAVSAAESTHTLCEGKRNKCWTLERAGNRAQSCRKRVQTSDLPGEGWNRNSGNTKTVWISPSEVGVGLSFCPNELFLTQKDKALWTQRLHFQFSCQLSMCPQPRPHLWAWPCHM